MNIFTMTNDGSLEDGIQLDDEFKGQPAVKLGGKAGIKVPALRGHEPSMDEDGNVFSAHPVTVGGKYTTLARPKKGQGKDKMLFRVRTAPEGFTWGALNKRTPEQVLKVHSLGRKLEWGSWQTRGIGNAKTLCWGESIQQSDGTVFKDGLVVLSGGDTLDVATNKGVFRVANTGYPIPSVVQLQ